MSTLDPEAPPVGEEIHLPGPSLQPFLLGFAITITLVGVTIMIPLVVAGLVMSMWIIVRWIGDARRDMRALPEDLDVH